MKKIWPWSALAALAMTQSVFAADVLVIGSQDRENELTGSGQFITEEEVQQNTSVDVHRLLRREVPGVSVIEEDGLGIIPNISFRGVNASRSFKLTLMEDGVLAAPAPYAAPAAYYSPYIGRMSGLEALKGSSQVQYGPSTTGGVLNYISTPMTTSPRTQFRLHAGSFRERQVQASHSDQVGNLSYLVEFAGREMNGFREVKVPENVQQDAKDTGQRRIEPMIKLAYDFEGENFQRLEFKYGHTDLVAKETYLGLTDEDFNADPFQRYAASRFDRLDAKQTRTHLRHYLNMSGGLDMITTLYYNKFERNWYKLKGIDLDDPAKVSLYKGEAAGTLDIKANNRWYESLGVEQKLSKTFGAHKLKLGWRVHSDYERRKQWVDEYNQAANGTISSIDRGEPGSDANRKASASAMAIYLQDEMTFGRWTFTPGVRVERVEFSYDDYKNTDPIRERDLTVLNPGVGFKYALKENSSVFGGLHLGSSLPDTGAATRESNPLDEEKSYNAELGYRLFDNQAFKFESTLFYTHLKDMIAVSSASTGTAESESIGKADTYGVELKTTYDLGRKNGWSFNNPYFLTATWNKTSIGGDYEDASYLTGEKGNSLPYSPELQFTAGTGISKDAWLLDLAGTYVGEVYDTGENLDSGKIDSHFTLDLRLAYDVRENTTLSLSVHNLLDKEYMVSRQPYGARVGRPQTLLVGLESDF